MSTTSTITKIESEFRTVIVRVNVLESELAQLKQKSSDDGDWVGKICGSFKDDPGYDEIIELGRQIRKSDFS